MSERLTKKEKGLADDYLETGNGTQSALNHYDTTNPDTAAVIASRTLRKDKVIAYLEENAEKVASNMIKLALSAESEQVQVAAGKDVLDRSGYKPVEKTVNLNVNSEITNPEARALAERFEEELKKGL